MNSTENSPKAGPNGKSLNESLFLAKILAALIAIEALIVTAGAVYFLFQIFAGTADNFTGAIVIFVITLIISAGLWAVAIALLKTQRWTRGAIVTWQILQMAIATSFLQGIEQWQPVGWVLVALAIAALLMVFLPGLKAGRD